MTEQNTNESNQEMDTPRGELELKTVPMPKDTNSAGDIFGGWLLSQMDLAAGVTAVKTAQGRVATIAIDAMKFVRPVKVGDLVCIYCSVEKIGNTSMSIRVEAWVEHFDIGIQKKVTEGIFTFVAIDRDGRSRPVKRN